MGTAFGADPSALVEGASCAGNAVGFNFGFAERCTLRGELDCLRSDTDWRTAFWVVRCWLAIVLHVSDWDKGRPIQRLGTYETIFEQTIF